MNKDLLQKQKAVRFCVAAGMIPYMEVIVRYEADVAAVQADISDVDVLGVRPAALYGARKVVFDCKTLNKVSAINRALWAAGLLRLINADEAYVILNKAAPEGHRLAANSINVRLTSEKLFDEFGKATSADYAPGMTYLDNASAWEWINGISRANVALDDLVHFLRNDAPLQTDACGGFRSLIAKLRHAEGEFDASKPPHVALWGLLLCESLRFLSEITAEFHNIFDPAMDRGKFEDLLRNFVWGGKESYVIRKKLRAQKLGEEASAFELPGWSKFLELVRSFLDAPHLVSSGIIPVKDLSFKILCDESKLADNRIKRELSANSRARQFALSTNKYLGGLSPHFKDCSDHFSRILTTI